MRRSLGASAARALVRNALRPVRAARKILPRNSEDLLDAAEPCDLVALQRVEQMGTAEVEPIDLRIIPVAPD